MYFREIFLKNTIIREFREFLGFYVKTGNSGKFGSSRIVTALIIGSEWQKLIDASFELELS
jgi:hypothetical protein